MPLSPNKSIAILGYGFVGQATELLLNRCGHEVVHIQDPDKGYVIADWNGIKWVFVCLPTPNFDGSLEIDLLEVMYNHVLQCGATPVIRSTVGPDQVERFPDAVWMPEFIRERHWQHDVKHTHALLFGGDVGPGLRALFGDLIINCVDARTAMLFKIARNAALATKVTLANELYELCEQLDTDYPQLESLLVQDGCMGTTHWQVPGPDGSRGFGGNCLPKDTWHLAELMNSDSVLHRVLDVNERIRDSHE